MQFHPNPVSMAIHVEHHRQELLDQAQQYRLAKEAAGDGAPGLGRAWSGLKATISSVRTLASRQRPTLSATLALPQSAPGEAT